MKSLIIILLFPLMMILFFSCGEETVAPTGSATLPNISGKIEDWHFGDSLKLKAELFVPVAYNNYTLDTCTIKSDGSFIISLKTPPENMLSVFTINWDTSCTGEITINPSNTMTSSFLNLRIYSQFSDTVPLGGVLRYNPRDTVNWTRPGDFNVFYVYSNNYATITGTKICTGSWFFPDTTIFSVNGVRGWNKIVYNYLSYSSSSIKMLVNTTEPPGAKWFAQIYYNKEVK